MAHILITSGPTRQYLDPVRYLTNASSGRMGSALAAAALSLGHEVTVISGPVNLDYPSRARVIQVISTEEMLVAARLAFADCDGLIGAAAPCDYRPQRVAQEKIAKTGEPLRLHLVETPDIVATLGKEKRDGQWVVGFALETNDARFRATVKLEKKRCDLIVLNGPAAMNSMDNDVEILDRRGQVVEHIVGTKQHVADAILRAIDRCLIAQQPSPQISGPQRSDSQQFDL
jgi:phosphopantothenoylcysteine decarboxylase/phosphopantothenate--cysteine ligase